MSPLWLFEPPSLDPLGDSALSTFRLHLYRPIQNSREHPNPGCGLFFELPGCFSAPPRQRYRGLFHVNDQTEALITHSCNSSTVPSDQIKGVTSPQQWHKPLPDVPTDRQTDGWNGAQRRLRDRLSLFTLSDVSSSWTLAVNTLEFPAGLHVDWLRDHDLLHPPPVSGPCGKL